MISTQTSDIRLTVTKVKNNARYMVLRQLKESADSPYLLLSIGNRETVRDAMKAAREAAAGVDGFLPQDEPHDAGKPAAAE